MFVFFQLKTIFINKNKSDNSVKNPVHPERSRSEFEAFSYSNSQNDVNHNSIDHLFRNIDEIQTDISVPSAERNTVEDQNLTIKGVSLNIPSASSGGDSSSAGGSSATEDASSSGSSNSVDVIIDDGLDDEHDDPEYEVIIIILLRFCLL